MAAAPTAQDLKQIKKLHRRWSKHVYPAGAFSSSKYLWKALGKPKPSEKTVDRALKKNILFLLHRDLQETFERRADSAGSFGERFEIDVADFGKKITQMVKRQFVLPEPGPGESGGGEEGNSADEDPAVAELNASMDGTGYKKGYLKRPGEPARYFLVAVDVFSRKVFARGLKDKSGFAIVSAFKNIFKKLKAEGVSTPRQLVSDQGGEFKNRAFTKMCQEENIQLTFAKGFHKARLAERAIRSMKRILAAAVQTGSWDKHTSWDALVQQAAGNINSRYNRTLGMSPNQTKKNYWRVMTDAWGRRHFDSFAHFAAVEKAIQNGEPFKDGGKEFRLGASVLLPRQKQRRAEVKDKESDMHYHPIPWQISAIFHGAQPAMYKVVNPRTGTSGKRLYYARELLPVKLPPEIDTAKIKDWRIVPGRGMQFQVSDPERWIDV